MRIAIYSRKSVYTGKGESIENQVEMCKQYIASHIEGYQNAQIVVYEDEGYSGKSFERPQFIKMMEDAKQEKWDYIVCYRLDRISRSVSDFAPFIEKLNQQGIAFVCIREQFDTSTPMGRAMMYIASVFAQLERETIAQRVRDNMLLLSRDGRWLGGTPPMGFTSEKIKQVIVNGKIKSTCRLKVNQEEIETIKVIYRKFLELQSLSGVCKYLIQNNLKSRSLNFYSILGIKDILQNPVYCVSDEAAFKFFLEKNADVCFEKKDCSKKWGILSYNKRDYSKKSAPRQPLEKWVIAIGKHEGIIPGKQWVNAQRILEENKKNNTSTKVRNQYSLLSGLITCKKCGSKMFAKRRSGQKDVFDYVCEYKLKGGKGLCDSKNIHGNHTDLAVYETLIDYIKEHDKDKCYCVKLNELKRTLNVKSKLDELSKLYERSKRLKQEMDGLVRAISAATYDQVFLQRLNDRMVQLNEELTGLNLEITRIQERENILLSDDELKNTITPIMDYSFFSLIEKRSLLRIILKRMEWDGTDLHLYLNSE